MKAKVITMRANDRSELAADRCIRSAEKFGIEVEKFSAYMHTAAKRSLADQNIFWNYPWNGEQQMDFRSGLLKVGYMTRVKEKRIACFLSHYKLWNECLESGEDYLILEHDAIFTRSLKYDFSKTKSTIIALNEPQRGATPNAKLYDELVRERAGNAKEVVVGIPYVNPDVRIPAGLPGNSAYYIKPAGAQKLIDLVAEFGAWPNDAIMCNQLLPGKLGILFPYVTKVHLEESTTTR